MEVTIKIDSLNSTLNRMVDRGGLQAVYVRDQQERERETERMHISSYF